MNLNTCPKCESKVLFRDDDLRDRFLIVVCPICGFRYYEYMGDVPISEDRDYIEDDEEIEARCECCNQIYLKKGKYTHRRKYCYSCSPMQNRTSYKKWWREKHRKT